MQKELFRALSVSSDTWIVSNSIKWIYDRLLLLDDKGFWIGCRPETRSVSYLNMIDKNGKRIFASLNEDGVGGDILPGGYIMIWDDINIVSNRYVEVIGIHKGE